ncbi:MAG: hypothetical protein M3Y23_07635, partial [Actinomycetota bacterium]|nr:hypothetical protein [Actinomycetota bacterium]
SLVLAATLTTQAQAAGSDSAILVLIPQDKASPPSYDEDIAEGLAGMPELSVGLVSATQGSYSARQALLDISQGTRVSRSTYKPKTPPQVGLVRMISGSGAVKGWDAIVERADTAPQTIVPGLFASSIPGGAAFVGDATKLQDSVIPAANELGMVSSLSLANSENAARRAQHEALRYGLVVVSTSPGRAGLAELRRLLRARPADQLVIAMQTPPDGAILPLLPIGAVGLQGSPAGLTSDSTNMPNLVAGIDIAPTVLEHLDLDVPDDMKGQAMRSDGERQPAELTPFRDRLDDLGPRRMPALTALAMGWLIILLAAGAISGARPSRLRVRRIGGLAILWIPAVILVPAALGNPSSLTEYLIIGGGSLGLGFLTDRFVSWPRAPLVPAVVGLTVITADLALGSHLITRSILGPNPGYGSRFYGIGNELKSGLMVLLLAGLAAYLTGRPKSRNAAFTVLGAGLVLCVILGSGRLGAGVGAAIIVASATAVATMMMLPGGLTRKRLIILVASPVIGLAFLAGLDILTSGGQGHYSQSVLSLDSFGSFWEIVSRRSTLAWQQLWKGNMPVITLICLLAAAYAIRNREMFLPWAGPIWPAALTAGLVGGLIGSVTEDSGPMLIVVATVALAGVCSYLLGRPDEAQKR